MELKEITFEIEGKRILDGINLSVKEGEFLAITGPNGSGKSTLMKIVMGILTPTSGKVLFYGEDITGLSIVERSRKGLALAFQTPVKIKGLKVEDIVKDPGKYLKMVGLSPTEYGGRELDDNLSGGELKRVEIASVLARDAELLMFDEPEAGIDLWSFKNLTNVFEKLKAKGRTVMILSHQEKILDRADRVVVLKDGKIMETAWK